MFSLSTEGGVCYTAHMAKIYIATEKHYSKKGNIIKKKIKIIVNFRTRLSISIEICFLFEQQAARLIQCAWRAFFQRKIIQRKEVFEIIFSFIRFFIFHFFEIEIERE